MDVFMLASIEKIADYTQFGMFRNLDSWFCKSQKYFENSLEQRTKFLDSKVCIQANSRLYHIITKR